jgi:predicted Zn-ribbon and HTH transcriptional regulator
VFDRESKSGEAWLFVFELYKYSFLMRMSGNYSLATLIESDGGESSKATVVLSGGLADGGSTDLELKILKSFKDPVLAGLRGLTTVYDSAWVYSDDETLRQKAVLSLEQTGGDTSIDKIIDLMKHDRSEKVLESAAISLGHMGGDKAVDPLMKIAVKNESLISTYAKALGDIGSPKALENLNQLLDYCKNKGLSAEANAVSQSIMRVKHGEGYKEVGCIVCDQPLEEGEQIVQCPKCKKIAHKAHMLEWLHVHGKCPSCGQELMESDLARQPVQVYLPQRSLRRSPSGQK